MVASIAMCLIYGYRCICHIYHVYIYMAIDICLIIVFNMSLVKLFSILGRRNEHELIAHSCFSVYRKIRLGCHHWPVYSGIESGMFLIAVPSSQRTYNFYLRSRFFAPSEAKSMGLESIQEKQQSQPDSEITGGLSWLFDFDQQKDTRPQEQQR